MMSAVQKSLIAETIHGARASLHEPSRPFTPGDLPRHLFQGDDYQNRPGSSYKMNNVVGQAVDEFQSVYPDESGYLEAIASYHGTRSVQILMHKLGERGDPGDFTMWLCFDGFLRSLS